MFDASGSMATRGFDESVAHARGIHHPDTAVIIDTGASKDVARTTLGQASECRYYGAGSRVGPRMLRECAMVHDEVVWYTDGYLDGDETVSVPSGRLSILVHGDPPAAWLSDLARAFQGATVARF